VAGLAFAMPLLSGHPETAAHSALAVVALAVFLWFFGNEGTVPRSLRFALVFLLAGVLGIGVASVQMIPTLEWMGQLGLQVEAPQPVLDRHQGQGLFSLHITTNPSSPPIFLPA